MFNIVSRGLSLESGRVMLEVPTSKFLEDDYFVLVINTRVFYFLPGSKSPVSD
jgi:hypothetical protein